MGIAKGHVFWLFGLSGAGKSTLAGKLRGSLEGRPGATPLMLDGDRLRDGLCRGLGFSDEDRTENLRRAAEVARLGVESGLVVIASFITPRETQRKMIEGILGAESLSMILLDAPLETCRQRDVKGLYRKAAAGTVQQMTGLTSAFDPPERFALRLETGAETLERSTARLVEFASGRLSERL